jgi:hypothetical protein
MAYGFHSFAKLNPAAEICLPIPSFDVPHMLGCAEFLSSSDANMLVRTKCFQFLSCASALSPGALG